MAGSGKPIGNIKLGISLDGTDFGNTLDEINSKVKQAESNMKANLKAYDSAGRSYEALSQKTKDLSTVMDGQNAKVKELTKRRDEAIEKYGSESKEVAKLNTQINNAIAKYNAYGKQLNDTKKELVYSQTAVNDLTDELKENERQMNNEVKALKSAGDEAGAFEAKQKGLTKQAELSERAMNEQRKVVALMADEFGDSADETEDARKELNKLERQTKLSDKQLEGLKNSADNAGREIDDFGDNASRSSRKLDGFKDKIGSLKGAFSFGAVAGIAHSAISRVIDGISGLAGEAITATDSLSKFAKTMEFAGFDTNEITKAKSEMKTYADDTVYGLEQVLNTSAQLASNGIPNYVELTKAAGNLNAVAGGSEETFSSVAMMLTQTAGAGKLTTENWNQLADAIPGASGLLQEAMLKNGAYTGNFRDAMAAGEVSSDEFNQALTELGMNKGAVEAATATDTLSGAWEQMKATTVSGLTEIITKIGVENITGFINKVTKGIEVAIPKIATFVGTLKNVGSWIVENRETLTWLVGIIGGIVVAIKGLSIATAIFGSISLVAGGLVVALGALVGALVIAYTKSETFRNIVNTAFNAVKSVITVVINALVQLFKNWWSTLTWLWGNIASWASNVWNKFGEMKSKVINTVTSLWSGIKHFFSDGIGNTWNAIRNWASNLLSHVGNLKNNLINVIKSLWNTIKNTFSSGISTVVNWMKALPGKIANGIKAGAGAVKNAFESIFKSAMNAVKKPINLIIDGASWVLEKLGGDKIKHWAPAYAQGTEGHPGGMMMVNDGAGAEMVVRPNGQAFIPQGQNITMYGEPGTQVIPAHDTAMLMGKKRSTFAYAKGTGGMFSNLWSNVKDVGSGILDSVKSAIGDVMDYIDDPGKLVSKLLGSNLLGGLTKWPLDVGGGILKKAKDALTSKVKEMFDSMSAGSFDGAMNANNVYQYLVDIAQKVMSKFGGLTVTSGYRAGDPYWHGKHQAIDISGYPYGSPRYTEAANWAFEKFPKQIAYVITNGRVRDRVGMSGQAASGQWVTWPDNDHYDHIHLNGSMGSGDIFQAGTDVAGGLPTPSGASVERWRPSIKKALKMNGLPTSQAYVNAWMSQIQT
ncbi:tape measure protein, partial [Enterococcus malodoratus]|uniref:tape measure protein n=1 Tax=Enterococcus malodoratus TaxID=71451 RepID=UPI002073C154